MRLTLHTDYALRLLMMLSADPDRRITVPDAAEKNGISRHHLMKVAQALNANGFVKTVRGKGGGLSLARPADAINLGDVVRAMEPDFSYAECIAPRTSDCCLLPFCGLNGILLEAGRAFHAILDRHTLADLVTDRAAALRLLEP